MGILGSLFIARQCDLEGIDLGAAPEEALPGTPCATLNGITHLALAELETAILKTPFTKLIKLKGQHPVGGYAWAADQEQGPWLVAVTDKLSKRLADASLDDLAEFSRRWFEDSGELLILLAGLCRQASNANEFGPTRSKNKAWRVYLWFSL